MATDLLLHGAKRNSTCANMKLTYTTGEANVHPLVNNRHESGKRALLGFYEALGMQAGMFFVGFPRFFRRRHERVLSTARGAVLQMLLRRRC